MAELIGTAAAAVAGAFVDPSAPATPAGRGHVVATPTCRRPSCSAPSGAAVSGCRRSPASRHRGPIAASTPHLGGIRPTIPGGSSRKPGRTRPDGGAPVRSRSQRDRLDTLTSMSQLRLPWLPEGRLVHVEGRGECFVRLHRHPDPGAPVLLLHGWTASSDLQFFTAYEALAARFTFVGIDHRGHGRGLRSPDAFTLEDAADDAAAVVRRSGSAGRRRRLLDGRADLAAPRPPPPRPRRRDRRAGDGAGVERDVARAGAVAGDADRRLVAAHQGLPALPQPGRAQADRRRPPRRAVRAVARQRDVPQRRLRHGRRRPGARRATTPGRGPTSSACRRPA